MVTFPVILVLFLPVHDLRPTTNDLLHTSCDKFALFWSIPNQLWNNVKRASLVAEWKVQRPKSWSAYIK
jgi:hypothetical protein